MNSFIIRGILMTIIGGLIMVAAIFWPAGTFYFWQGWAFFATFEAASQFIGIYFMIHDRKLVERRMKIGPTGETEMSQKIISSLFLLGFVAIIVLPGLDHRFHLSPVPAYVSCIGDVLVVFAFIVFFYVLKQNSWAASTIQVEEGQKVISTGLYGIVRHPMYSGALLLLVAMPLALGSWWSLGAIIPFLPVLAWRLLDEERYLHKNLPGYTEYTQKVHYRLVPHAW